VVIARGATFKLVSEFLARSPRDQRAQAYGSSQKTATSRWLKTGTSSLSEREATARRRFGEGEHEVPVSAPGFLGCPRRRRGRDPRFLEANPGRTDGRSGDDDARPARRAVQRLTVSSVRQTMRGRDSSAWRTPYAPTAPAQLSRGLFTRRNCFGRGSNQPVSRMI